MCDSQPRLTAAPVNQDRTPVLAPSVLDGVQMLGSHAARLCYVWVHLFRLRKMSPNKLGVM